MARSSKRQTKHKGNAAGVIEKRGGTGSQSKASVSKSAKNSRATGPILREPSWKGSAFRAMLITGIFLAVMSLTSKNIRPLSIVLLGLVMLLAYIPLGYYTDRFFYRRRAKQLGIAIPGQTAKAKKTKKSKDKS